MKFLNWCIVKVMIIGFSGKLGTGKSYYTKYTVSYLRKLGYQVLELAFGDQIKIDVLTKEEHSEYLSRHSVYEKKDDYSRDVLQKYGTEKGRANDENIWVKYIDEWIYLWRKRGITHFVISDIRFKNELEYVKTRENSCIFRIDAPCRNLERLDSEYSKDVVERLKNHVSETDLDNEFFDYILLNDTKIIDSKGQEHIKDWTSYNKSIINDKIQDLLYKSTEN